MSNGSELFFNKGTTFASFHIFGKIPSVRILLYICSNSSMYSSGSCLITSYVIWSAPGADVFFVLDKAKFSSILVISLFIRLTVGLSTMLYLQDSLRMYFLLFVVLGFGQLAKLFARAFAITFGSVSDLSSMFSAVIVWKVLLPLNLFICRQKSLGDVSLLVLFIKSDQLIFFCSLIFVAEFSFCFIKNLSIYVGWVSVEGFEGLILSIS